MFRRSYRFNIVELLILACLVGFGGFALARATEPQEKPQAQGMGCFAVYPNDKCHKVMEELRKPEKPRQPKIELRSI